MATNSVLFTADGLADEAKISMSQNTRRRSERNPFQKNEREKEKPKLRVRKNEKWGVVADKYWLGVPKSKREKWSSRIIYIGMVAGLLGTIAFGVWGYFEGRRPATCPYLSDDFRYGTIDQTTWRHEISMGGGQAGSFEWTTDSTNNSFIKNNQLHIRPTIVQNYPEYTSINLTADSTCTDPYFWCSAEQNTTAGTTINPVQSAKLSTKLSMQYGEVEVKVKFPKGNWIWSQIQMNPVDDYYGAYPANGQMILAQNRGNDYKYSQGGNDQVDSFLSFGPDGYVGFGKTRGADKKLKFKEFSDGFHTIGMQWTPKYFRTYIDDPINTVTVTNYKSIGGFWSWGNWEPYIFSGLFDPWAVAYPSLAAPFDRSFYLTLQVGVGGMNGIFDVDQPWTLTEGRDTALTQFRSANTTWYPEWPEDDDRDMIIDSVVMRKQCVVKPVGL